ncbi:MAG: DsbC family protein, partial [Gammaproteobacteria bacterium]
MNNRWLHLILLFSVSVACRAEIPDVVKDALNHVIPGVAAKNIKPAPMPNWYQGRVGSRLLYVTADGEYLIDGQVFDLKNHENLTENALNDVRKEQLVAIDESTMVIFEAPDERYRVTVFTDVDCGYCRKLHNNMAEYNQR